MNKGSPKNAHIAPPSAAPTAAQPMTKAAISMKSFKCHFRPSRNSDFQFRFVRYSIT